jgi:hypothetical protein
MDDDDEPTDIDRPRLAWQLDDTSTGYRAHHVLRYVRVPVPPDESCSGSV